MAKLTRNAFIEKHKQGTLVAVDFADFRRLKTPARFKHQKSPKKPHEPQYQLVKLHEPSIGKIFPTPNQIITALAKGVLRSDYFIESGVAGTVQALYIANDAQAKALADEFPHGPPKPGNGKPAKLVYSAVVDAARAETLARRLKLL